MSSSLPVTDMLMNRHTVRNYDATHVIPKERIAKIMEAVRLSPTAYTCQDVDFVVCSNRATNQKATNEMLKVMDEKTRGIFASRKDQFKVTNVITCDASVEVIIYKNERAGGLAQIHAGIAAMAICCAAKEFGLDTMCHTAMLGAASEAVYGIPKGSSIVAVAIGKARPDAHFSERQHNNAVKYLE